MFNEFVDEINLVKARGTMIKGVASGLTGWGVSCPRAPEGLDTPVAMIF